jgi:hypothetical protein
MMKKMILMAAIIMATTTAFAQRQAGSMTIQPRIGVSAADFNNTSDTEARVGLIVGPEFEYFVSDRFSLAAGFNYSQQGAEVTSLNTTFKNDYITVPVVANIYLFKGFALKAGLQPGFKTKADLEIEGNGGKVSANIKDDVKPFDLSIPVGLSYEFKHFVIDARYTFGTTEIFKDNALDLDSKNLTFQLTLGYKLDI